LASNGFTRRFSAPRWRIGLTLACLLSFTGETFLAQAHLHSRNAASVTQSASASADQPDAGRAKQQPNKSTGSDESSRCPLCQFLLLGSAALLPSFFAPAATALAVSIAFVDQASPSSIAAVSYSWQSRGPPLT